MSSNRSLINTVVLVSLTSIVYIYPFGSSFRFTIAIVLLTTFLLYFEQLSILYSTVITGAIVVLLRGTIDILLSGHGYMTAFTSNIPALAYYVSYGLVFHALAIRKYADHILNLILLLSVTDIASNIVELGFRLELVTEKSALIFPSIVGVAVVRAILAVAGYCALRQYQSFILSKDQAERYIEQTVLIAKLKCELFYLEKSSQDIENVMEKSYWLYKKLNSKEEDISEKQYIPADEALAVAREIHEIKKDYNRVVAGIENVLMPSSKAQEVRLSDILYIIEQNTIRYLSVMDKKMTITYNQADDFFTDKHYTLVSILDNLIMNSIEACSEGGVIRVVQTSSNDEVFFCVEDNGSGIDSKEFDLIFNPGYSTKFSPRTGKISTGLGLAHVKILVELLHGAIRVESVPGVCTRFFITFPYSGIMTSGIGNDHND
ncbi:MAG: ATP-binding region ATPase domain protein [Firmicutes bacterium]|nr:ATP-binding region ATPase domain protein [Bacillota bacterium]